MEYSVESLVFPEGVSNYELASSGLLLNLVYRQS